MKEIQLKTPSGKPMAFTDGSDNQEQNLIVICWGVDHSGKSRLGATGPEIAGYVPLDRKTRAIADKTAKLEGRRILMPKHDFVVESTKGIRSGHGSDEKVDADIAKLTEATKKQFRQHVDLIKECAYTLYDAPEVKLIEIDLFGQFYEWMKYAYYGRTGSVIKRLTGNKVFKDTSDADQEIIDFVNSLSGKHLILTHKSTGEYLNNVATGAEIWKGFKHLGHNANLQVEMVLNKKFNPNSEKDSESWHYGLNIVKSLHKPELEGEAGQLILRDEMITFDNLKSMVLED